MQGKDTEDNVLNASYKHSVLKKSHIKEQCQFPNYLRRLNNNVLIVNTGIVFSYILCYVFFWNSVLKLK